MVFLFVWWALKVLTVFLPFFRFALWILRVVLTGVLLFIPALHWFWILILSFNMSISSYVYLCNRFVPTHGLNQRLDWISMPGKPLQTTAYFDDSGWGMFQSFKQPNKRLLTAGYPYSVEIQLLMPESDLNLNLGMFTIQLDMIGTANQTLATSKRSTMLRYRPPSVRGFDSILFFLPHYFGLMEHTQDVNVLLLHDFIESNEQPFHHAKLTIHVPSIHIYSSKLNVKANLRGLVYFLTEWTWTSAVLCISLLFMAYSACFFTMRIARSLMQKVINLTFILSGGNLDGGGAPSWLSYLWSVVSFLRYFV
eukprot:TRINITY_DN8499_c0_g1_i1.p1 TRINITY_DN8499_c0_g1~~TRINITY_DN8499_c0_g1_i1.p1  ORF type:complete len:309 (+),score=34.67 TRINITY_DN8499_c0_g1_i1:53-979(+)